MGVMKGKLKPNNRKMIGLFKNQYSSGKRLQIESQSNLAYATDSSTNGHMEHFLTSLSLSICTS